MSLRIIGDDGDGMRPDGPRRQVPDIGCFGVVEFEPAVHVKVDVGDRRGGVEDLGVDPDVVDAGGLAFVDVFEVASVDGQGAGPG